MSELLPRQKKLIAPPEGKQFAWQTPELLGSLAWREMSQSAFRVVTFLMIEHLSEAGRENGNLNAGYDRLARWGVSRRCIAPAIRELVTRGLVRITVKGGIYGPDQKRTPSTYRLTWIGTLNPECAPTNDWRRFNRKRSVSRRSKSISRGPQSGALISPTFRPYPLDENGGNAQAIGTTFRPLDKPHKVVQLSISRGDGGQGAAPLPVWVRALRDAPEGQYAGLVARLSLKPTSTDALKKSAPAKRSKIASSRVLQ